MAIAPPRLPELDVVARDLRSHPVTPNPLRNTHRASFDELGGNSTISILLTEFGAERTGHRHLDEATTFIVAGSGYTEVRPEEDGPATRIAWAAGDVFAIPSNAWHRHEGQSSEPARQLTFKNTALMSRLFGSRAFVRENAFHFEDRYADVETWQNAIHVADWGNTSEGEAPPPLESRPDLGGGVSAAKLPLAGQRILEPWLVRLDPMGRIDAHHHLAEEVCVVLAGSGSTKLQLANGDQVVEWSVGDLVAHPLGLEHTVSAASEGATLLLVRNVFVDVALGPTRAEPLRLGTRAGGDA